MCGADDCAPRRAAQRRRGAARHGRGPGLPQRPGRGRAGRRGGIGFLIKSPHNGNYLTLSEEWRVLAVVHGIAEDVDAVLCVPRICAR